jgi:hypothetical protein
MRRWTVRNVDAQSIQAVQELSAEFGVGLGEIVSACIETGIGQVRARLLATETASEPAPNLGGGLDEIFRSIKLLADGLPPVSSRK